MPKKTPLERAIEARGTAAKLARELGITAQAISQWDQVPAERVGKVSALTGIPPHELRPDLFEAA